MGTTCPLELWNNCVWGCNMLTYFINERAYFLKYFGELPFPQLLSLWLLVPTGFKISARTSISSLWHCHVHSLHCRTSANHLSPFCCVCGALCFPSHLICFSPTSCDYQHKHYFLYDPPTLCTESFYAHSSIYWLKKSFVSQKERLKESGVCWGLHRLVGELLPPHPEMYRNHTHECT